MKKGKKSRLLSATQIKKSLERFAKAILREHKDLNNLALIGIRTRGIYLAKRIRETIRKTRGREVALGEMDITLYRDDLNTLLPEGRVDRTDIPFDINNKAVILVDDVLNTGRTVRAAVDHLIDLGRARTIHLAVLIDRGGRELPIAANFVGKKVKAPSRREAEIQVKLKETDRVDEVILIRA